MGTRAVSISKSFEVADANVDADSVCVNDVRKRGLVVGMAISTRACAMRVPRCDCGVGSIGTGVMNTMGDCLVALRFVPGKVGIALRYIINASAA